MVWPVVRRRSSRVSLTAIAVLLWCALWPVPAGATDTDIGVSICGGATTTIAEIAITQPLSDSVVDDPVVTFRGSIAHASQVEVSLNGQYNGTFAVGANETTFETDITLPSGTHTVLMKANAICGGQDAQDSVVVTYSPSVQQPTNGDNTPTSVDGKMMLDGTPASTETVEENSLAKTIEQLPLIGAAVSVVSDFATAIGLESTVVGANGSTSVAGVARVGVTVAALTSVVMASSLAPLAVQAVPGVSEVFNVSNHRSMLYLGWIIRGVGVLSMALAYFI